MKKCILILFVYFISYDLSAQNVQFHWDFLKKRNYPTVTFEMFKPDKSGTTYFFVDFDFPDFKDMGMAYLEFSHNFKLGKFPLMLHAEYNGGLFVADEFAGNINNAWLLGASWPFTVKKANFELIAAYKHIMSIEKKANFQLTGVWGISLFNHKISFDGFVDFWTEGKEGAGRKLIIITEPQLWYNFSEHIAVGSEIEISSNFIENNCYIFPTLGAKWFF